MDRSLGLRIRVDAHKIPFRAFSLIWFVKEAAVDVIVIRK